MKLVDLKEKNHSVTSWWFQRREFEASRVGIKEEILKRMNPQMGNPQIFIHTVAGLQSRRWLQGDHGKQEEIHDRKYWTEILAAAKLDWLNVTIVDHTKCAGEMATFIYTSGENTEW